MKSHLLFGIIICFFSCTYSSKNEFDYHTAIKSLREDIDKLDYSRTKVDLLRKTELILNEDSTFAQNLNYNTYDELKQTIIWKEYFKLLKRQLELSDINLLTPQDRIEAYKFSYARSFSDELVFITIYTQDDKDPRIKAQIIQKNRECNPMLGAKNLDGSCFKVLLNTTANLPLKKWQAFKGFINEIDFWNLKEIDYSNSVIYDGSEWEFDALKTISIDSIAKKRIYFISPEDNTSSYRLGTYLLELVDYDFGKIY